MPNNQKTAFQKEFSMSNGLRRSMMRVSSILSVFAILIAGAGCKTASKKAAVSPSKQVQRDFYTCRGFDHGLPVDVTSEFDVREDGLVYVVADLEKEQKGNRLDFELTSPGNVVTYMERVILKEDRPYGFYFDTKKMYERGGGGPWKALFWADGEPVGRLYFNLFGEAEEQAAQAGAAGSSIFDSILGPDAIPEDLPEEVSEEVSEATLEADVTAPSDQAVEEGILLTPGETWEAPVEQEGTVPEQLEEKVEQE
jgi:hypothetical protein